MTIVFKHPTTGEIYRVPDEYAGKIARAGDINIRIPDPYADGMEEVTSAPADVDEPVGYDDYSPGAEEEVYAAPAYAEEPVGEFGYAEEEPVEEPAYADDEAVEEFADAEDEPVDMTAPAMDFDDESEMDAEPLDEGSADIIDEDVIEDDIIDSDEDDMVPSEAASFAEEAAAILDEDDEDDEDFDDDEAQAAPKSLVGRIMIFVAAACLIAGLFLPWVDVAENWFGEGTPAQAWTGLEIATTASANNPMLYMIFGALTTAVLLALMAILPSLLAGTLGMILGLLFSLASVGLTAATLCLMGSNSPEAANGIGAQLNDIVAHAGPGLYVTLAGGLLAFIGGLISSFGAFRIKGGCTKAAPARRPRNSARAGRRNLVMPGKSDEETIDTEEAKPKKEKPARPSISKKGGIRPPFAKKGKKKASRKINLQPKKGGGAK